MAFFVYVLRNPQGQFYVGQTSNLEARLQRHTEGKVTWTKNRGSWEFLYSEPVETRSAAVLLERRLLGVSGFGQFWVREIGVKKLLV